MVQAVSPCLARCVRGSASLMGLISFLSRRLLRRVLINDQARAAPYDLLPERALFRFGSDSGPLSMPLARTRLRPRRNLRIRASRCPVRYVHTHVMAEFNARFWMRVV